ncbi:hypothetical protein TrCOL_g7935 [Triparma columacea]|uniref:Uncharacterized protein n=1 Tax=Triparma columacea TaxID=722753 RepID=A0A9W7G9B3_9STRA|nr:hypothetical protein TrCOL_g7935 [Triparma columacea]
MLSVLGYVGASSSGSTSSLYDASADLFNIDGAWADNHALTRLPPTHVGLISLPLPGSLSPLLALSSHLVKEGHRVSLYSTDDAIDILPVGTIKKQAVRECGREHYHWNGDRSMYKSFATFGLEDMGASITEVGVDGVSVDDNWEGDESDGKAGMYFCGCLLNFPSGSKWEKRDRAYEKSLPGSAEASNACDMLESFGRSKILHPPPGILEEVLQIGGVRALSSNLSSSLEGGEHGEMTFRSQGPLFNPDASARILDSRERAENAKPKYTHPFPPDKGWGTADGDAYWSRGTFRLSANGGIDFSKRSFLFNMTKITSRRGSFNGVLNLAHDIYLSATVPLYLRLKGIIGCDPPKAVFVDLLSFGGHLAVEQLKIPSLVNSPTLLPDLGTGSWSSYYPSFGTGYGSNMTLVEKCWNLLLPRFLSVSLAPMFSLFNSIRWGLGLGVKLSFNVDFADVIMVDTNVGFDFPRPVGDKIRYVGPLLSDAEAAGRLDKIGADIGGEGLDIKAMLEGYGEKGGKVVYVNLGSMTRITKNQARTVMQGLTSAARDFNGMRVLWVVDEDDINVMPKHLPSFVKVAIRLRGVSDHYYTNHEEVALTVSHCGLTAAQASLVNSKPVVCIPFFGDQFDVAVRVRESGAGVVVRREGEHIVEGPQVYEAVTKVLEDLESFQRAAYAVSRRLLDAGGSLEALKLLDIVRRMQGKVKPERRHLLYNFDSYGVVFALICIAASLISIFVRVVMLCMEGKLKTNDKETRKG